MRTAIFAILASMLILGCLAQPPAQNQSQSSPSKPYKRFTAQDLPSINLQPSDVPADSPLGYDPNQSQGLMTDAVAYTDAQTAPHLLADGWLASHDIEFDTRDRLGVLTDVDSAISVYKNASRFPCVQQEVSSYFLNGSGPNFSIIRPTRPFGSGDAAEFHGYFPNDTQSGRGMIEAYELRFYRGNVFVNIEMAGAIGTVNQSEIERFGAIEDQKLVSACGGSCEPAPQSCG